MAYTDEGAPASVAHMQHESPDAEVQALLDRMSKAMTSGDIDAMATIWGYPALLIGDQLVEALKSGEDIKRIFAGVKEDYNKRGIADTHAEVFGLEWIGDRMLVADVRWPYVDRSGKDTGEAEASSYTFRRDDAGELKLHVALMRGVTSPG